MKLIAILTIAVSCSSCAGLGISYSGPYGTATTGPDGTITYTPPARPIVIGGK